MELHSEYLLDLTIAGLAMNGLACGMAPTPSHLMTAFGKPSRVLRVKRGIATNREQWIFDELGIRALVEDDGAVLHDVCAYFETGYKRPELAEAMPKEPYRWTVRLGRYRLRQGISFEAAMEVEKVRLNGFRIGVSEYQDRVATCDIAVPLLS